MSKKNEILNASDLLGLDIAELRFFVENLIVQGLTILAAAPKAGKSYLTLYLAYCIAIGQLAFGKMKVKQSKVLYLALEDNPRRLKKRLKQIVISSLTGSIMNPDNLDLLTHLEGKDKTESLKKLITENRYDVVLVDILQRAANEGETGSYKKEYNLIRKFKKIADETNCSIVVVHHTNKKSKGIDSISGTRGLVGACDNILVLTRTSDEENSKKGTLKLEVQGRDVDSNTYFLKYGTSQGFYVMSESEPTESSKDEKIEKAWELKQRKYTQEQIAELMGVSQSYVCKLLKAKKEDLLSEGNLDDAEDIDQEDNDE